MKREVSMDKFGPPNPLPEAPNEEAIPPAEEPDRISLEEADSYTGCVFDDHRGHYIGKAVIELALERGWHDADEATIRDLVDRYDDEYFLDSFPHEVWQEIVDDAERWLNDVVAPEGYSYGFHADAGGFFFMPAEWWCDEPFWCDDPEHSHFEERAAARAANYNRHG